MKPKLNQMTAAAFRVAIALGGLAFAGCQEPRFPARVDVPQRPGEGVRFERDEVKPLPRPDPRANGEVPPAPFDDVPLVTQSPPEQKAYVRAYNEVGRPRIVVAVNRNATPDVDASRTGKGGDTGNGGGGGVGIRTIDTEAVENILTDWFAADGQVDIISPLAQGKPLTDKQKDDLRGGEGNAVARDIGGDVVVQVSSRITEQAGQDLQLRMVAEAVNVGDGRSIGRAFVDVPAPLDKPKINKYTRFMARKLMDGMILTWQRMAKEGTPGGAAPASSGGAPPFRPAEPGERSNAAPPVIVEPQPAPAPRVDLAPAPPADTAPAPKVDAPPAPPAKLESAPPLEDVPPAPPAGK